MVAATEGLPAGAAPFVSILSSLRVHCQESLMAASLVYPYDRQHFLFKTVRYFSRKDGFIGEQQKIAICSQLPWRVKSKSHLPLKENTLCYREEKEVERAAVNRVMAFHWLSSCQERRGISAYCWALVTLQGMGAPPSGLPILSY